MYKYLPYDRTQSYLLPPSLDDWLPSDHLARFIVDIVEELDISNIDKHYGIKGGKKAYDPKILLALLFYGYATGVFSSRKIERATYDSVAFRFIGANNHPDHDTIAYFRQRFLQELETLFVQILLIAKESGLLKVGTVSLDGTKIKANASKHKALSYLHAQQLEKQLEDEVKILMQKAKEIDNSESNDGMNIPDEIARREDRLQVIKKAKATIEQRAKEKYKKELQEYERKITHRQTKEKLTGKKPKGKTPQPPVSEKPNDKDQVNLTDEQSRIMPMSGGGFIQSYNAQASVENDSRLIIHNHVTQNVNDKLEIEPSLVIYNETPQLKPKAISADAGYFSQDNLELCESNNIIPYISFGKEQHNQPIQDRFKEPDILPDDPTIVEKNKYRLQTKQGKQIYAKRKSTVEPVFGIIKQIQGFRQFFLRGFQKAKGEWNLMCIGYNLKRMHIMVNTQKMQ